MSEFKGTKGKWTAYYWRGTGSVIDILRGGGDVNTEPAIAQVYSLTETNYKIPFNDEHKANALLISKAPEMLDMLKETLYTLEIAGLESTENYKKIKQLIKQATKL